MPLIQTLFDEHPISARLNQMSPKTTFGPWPTQSVKPIGVMDNTLSYVIYLYTPRLRLLRKLQEQILRRPQGAHAFNPMVHSPHVNRLLQCSYRKRNL